MHPRRGFTLIELLVVIAIVAVLAVTVILTLNPADLLKQARDSNRLSDLATLNKALGLIAADVSNASFGSTSTVYISLPDTSSSCSNLGLPTLPAGWSYGCASTTTLTRTDGTGWIPVNFNALGSGSPLSRLPIDPVNTIVGGRYYSYVNNNGWELTMIPESKKYGVAGQNIAKADSGDSASLYEQGSHKTLHPISDAGLLGHWTFDEGSGTSVSDSSGNGRTGTWSLGTGTRWVSGKVGESAGYFQNSSYYVDLGSDATLQPDAFTVTGWMKSAGGNVGVCWNAGTPCVKYNHASSRPIIFLGASIYRYLSGTSTTDLYDNQWHFVVFTVPGNLTASISTSRMVVDGKEQAILQTGASGAQTVKTYLRVGAESSGGSMDDMRLFNRVLSDAEIAAIYNATR